MKTGTCYFPTRTAAIEYYKPYMGMIVRGGQINELNDMVDRKIKDGEIHIGKPRIKPGEQLVIEDNRYHIIS